MILWGFSGNGIAANSARDIGGRLVAISIWGTQASGGKYAAIAALTNIPATILATMYYNVFLADTQRGMTMSTMMRWKTDTAC
jgi:glycerol uptake facilitator-like aquaporin